MPGSIAPDIFIAIFDHLQTFMKNPVIDIPSEPFGVRFMALTPRQRYYYYARGSNINPVLTYASKSADAKVIDWLIQFFPQSALFFLRDKFTPNQLFTCAQRHPYFTLLYCYKLLPKELVVSCVLADPLNSIRELNPHIIQEYFDCCKMDFPLHKIVCEYCTDSTAEGSISNGGIFSLLGSDIYIVLTGKFSELRPIPYLTRYQIVKIAKNYPMSMIRLINSGFDKVVIPMISKIHDDLHPALQKSICLRIANGI